MNTMKRDLDLERAVYVILESGPMTPEKSALFQKPLAAMIAEKLVRRTPDGGHELVNAPSKLETNRSRPPVMVTLTARVPAEYLELLDRIGPTRSEALRHILESTARESAPRQKKG